MSFAPKHPSGVDLIDDAWGGLYRGGSYLVYGQSSSGCGLLALACTRTGARLGESTLFISADRQKNLVIQAASIGFDLRRACNSGIVRLMHVPPVVELREMEDDRVARALDDLVTLIRKNRPTRLVMNDFMPFVSFTSFNRFRHEFVDFLAKIDPVDTTMMLVMPEPANEQSRRVIDFMADEMTGSIHVELPGGDADTTLRKFTLTPHVGHLRRQIVERWDLEKLVPSRPPDAEEAVDERAPEPSPERAPDPTHEEPARTQTADEPSEIGRTTDDKSVRPRLLTPPVGTVFREIPTEFGPYDVEAPGEVSQIESAPPPAEQVQPETEPFPPQPRPTSAPPESHRPTRDVRRPGESSRSTRSESEGAPQPNTPHDESMMYPPSTAEPEPRASGETPFEAPDLLETRPASPVAPGAPETTDREAFRIRLQQRFNTREAVGEPFLLVALRMDRSRGREIGPFDFEFLMDLVHDSIQASDDLLVDPSRERLVVMLAGAGSDDAQPFFADLKERLREHSPARSEDLLQSVSAIVVPDGQPFRSAEEFLGYALDED